MTEKIEKMMSQMTDEEIRQRLAEYMENDIRLKPPLVAVEVRLAETANTKCRYDVLLIDEDGVETPVKFRDRYSRLLYIYTLLHPLGYQRRSVAKNNYRALCLIYHTLYFRDSDALLSTIESTDVKKPGHFLNHYIAQSRTAIRQTSPLADDFAIDRPQLHNGKLLIPFVANGGTVIIDESLRNTMSHH